MSKNKKLPKPDPRAAFALALGTTLPPQPGKAIETELEVDLSGVNPLEDLLVSAETKAPQLKGKWK